MTLITHSATYATKHAARTLATTLILHSDMLTFEEADELGAEMRDIFASLQECLSRIEGHVRDSDTAKTLRIARHYAEDIAEILGNAYPPCATEPALTPRDQFTPITLPSEIEALDNRRELIVGGAVWRVLRHNNGALYVRDLGDKECITPDAFVLRFGNTEHGILLRH